MKNNEILEKAIEKAIKNGYKQTYEFECLPTVDYYLERFYVLKQFYPIIFSHEFAKAFWGEEKIEMNCSVVEIEKWKYHLQQMILEKEPLKYLEKYL